MRPRPWGNVPSGFRPRPAGPETSAFDVDATAEPVAEMDRLGDEIAELSAHLDASTARLLDPIREFDAGGG